MHKLDKAVRKNKSGDLVSQMHDYGVDLESNHIYLFETDTDEEEDPGVEYRMSSRFITNLNLCMRVNPEMPILIHMKTGGGSWAEGMAIYNAIKATPQPVTILAYTYASSMSSLILLAGTKRVMMLDAEFMFHDGSLGISGTRKQVHSYINHDKYTDTRTMQIYIDALKERGKFKKWSRERIEQMLRRQMDRKEDVYLTAEQAVEWGFADEVFGKHSYDWSKLTDYTELQLAR